MIPKNIRKEHIIKAIEEIDRKGVPKSREARKFNLLYNWKLYPPKYVVSLADKYANGVELNSEVFGGGEQTNDFLQRLGFEISEGNLRIARIVLDIGVSKSKLKETGDPWTEHRNLISSKFSDNAPKYKSRIQRLLEKCIQENANVVIFPARTMIYRNKRELDFYLKISKEIPWVTSGSLKIEQGSNKYINEYAEVLHFGKPVEKFNIESNIALWMQMDSFSSMIAISSTIDEIRKGKTRKSKILSPNSNSHVLVFDLGHHQYNGRYTRTMKSVLKSIETKSGKKKAIILAYWKYLNARPYYYWYEPDSSWIKVNRILMKEENNVRVDFLDIIDIKL